MSNWRLLVLSLFLSFLIVLAVQAQAPVVDVLTYDTYVDFNAAYPADTVHTFEDQGPGDAFYGEFGYAEAGALITATDAYLFIRSNATRNGFIYGALGGASSPSPAHIQMDLPPGTNAFGAHLTGFFVNQVGELKVTLSTGQEFLVETTGRWYSNNMDPRDWDFPSFFGVITAVPFEWVRVEVLTTDYLFGTDYVVLDTVSFGHSNLLGKTVDERLPESVCGDGAIEDDEACDDGNLDDADGCSADCLMEADFVCEGEPSACFLARAQTDEQRECIVAVNSRGTKLAKAYNKSASKCLKHAAEGKRKKLGPGRDIASCLTADVEGRVDRAVDKLLQHEEDSCLTDQLPDYAYMGSVAVMTTADDETMGLLEALFGDPAGLDQAASGGGRESDDDSDTDSDSDSDSDPAAECQSRVFKRTAKLYDAKMKTFVECKEGALMGGVQTADELQAEILACVAGDPDERILRAAEKLAHKMTRKCRAHKMNASMEQLFQGTCADQATSFEADPGTFMGCLDEVTACHFCKSMNGFDGFQIDCDEYDNGLADLSCL